MQKDCGVDDLKMSDYGFTPDELPAVARGARAMQGGLFAGNPCEMTDDDVLAVLRASCR